MIYLRQYGIIMNDDSLNALRYKMFEQIPMIDYDAYFIESEMIDYGGIVYEWDHMTNRIKYGIMEEISCLIYP